MDRAAQELVAALYRGLGSDLQHLTGPVRRRELAIAAQLVAVGAAPGEAEAYAREMAARANRLAPIDLRGFERERASWLARREDARTTRRYVDRTGQGIVQHLPETPPSAGPHAAGVVPPATGQQPEDKAWLPAVQARLEGTDHAG